MTDGFSPVEQEKLIKEFLYESEMHIETLNKDLLVAEENVKNGKEVASETIDSMFRAVHTIKGAASFLGFTQVHTLAHNMETFMDKVRRKEMVLTAEGIDVLFKGFDGLEKIFESLEESDSEEINIDEYLAALESVIDGKKEEKSSDVKADKPKQEEEIDVEAIKAELAAEQAQDKVEEAPKPKRIKIDKSKYITEFVDETNLNIDKFNNIALELEKDRENNEHVQELFRIAHTIKGAAGTMGIVAIEEVVHKMESILDKVRNGEMPVSDNLLSCAFSAVDAVSDMSKKVEESYDNANALDNTEINARLEAFLSGKTPSEVEKMEKATNINKSENESKASTHSILELEAEKEAVLKAIDKSGGIYAVDFCIREDMPLKDIKLLLVKEKLNQVGILLKVVPDPDDEKTTEDDCANPHLFVVASIKEEEVKDIVDFDGMENFSIVKISDDEIQTYKDKFLPKENVKKATVSSASNGKSQDVAAKAMAENNKKLGLGGATVRIDITKLDNLMNLAGELVIIKAQLNQLVTNLGDNFRKQKEYDNRIAGFLKSIDQIKTNIKAQLSDANNENVATFLDKELSEAGNVDGTFSEGVFLEKISLLVSELGETTSKLGKISSDIQSGVMETRMIPVEGVFTRFRRVVRDMSKELDKDISLIIIGEDTELDKKIIDDLGDPLTHMIRNAIDHGIESKADRVAKGKSEKGTIILKASHEGNRICITISDDGKGLDKDAIVQKAISKGLVTAEQVEDLTDREKLEFIFMPGFSTAAQVTELSGRGVGMDVVRKMIENVNGTVDIQSELGKGTTFSLKIPLTLAIIPALLAVVGGKPYAFPLEAVVEIIKIQKNEMYLIDGNDTVKLRDHALSIVDLNNVIDLDIEKKEEDSQKVVVIGDDTDQIGVSVDSLIGEEEIVIKSLSEHFAAVIGIAGASVLGDGQIALIIDPLSVIKEAKSNLL